jgi:hypothetical protein
MSYVKKLPTEVLELYQYGRQIMHLGLGMTLFFPRPFQDVQKEIWALWQSFLSLVGEDCFTWARLGGGNKSRKVSAATFKTIESWLTGKKDYGKICWISIHDGPMDDLGQYSFMLTGFGEPKDNEFDIEAGFVEIALPLSFLDSLGPAKIADSLIAMARPVPFYCGVAGFVFHRSPYKYDATIGKMRALSRRFEGVEISANERLCYLASTGLTTVNWITFVGAGYIEKLGGVKQVETRLPSESVVLQLPHGIAIRTGERPLLGDKNAGRDELSAWREVYKVLKPVQFVDPEIAFDPFEFNGEQTVDWLERLG